MEPEMDMLVIYSFCMSSTAAIGYGNIDAVFRHDPPTITDIRDMEREISSKHCNGAHVVILDWKPITPEETEE